MNKNTQKPTIDILKTPLLRDGRKTHRIRGSRTPICQALAACNARGIRYVEENDFMKTYKTLHDWLRGPFPIAHQYPGEDQTSEDKTSILLKHVSLPQGCRFSSHTTMASHLGSNSELVVLKHKSRTHIKSRLVLDGTPESYWETSVLHFLSPQILMFWHGLYETCDMVFDLRRFFTTYRAFGFTGRFVYDRLSTEGRELLFNMDFFPSVTLGEKSAVVLFTAFSPFKGFKRVRLSIVPRKVGFNLSETIVSRLSFRIPLCF